MFSYVLIALWLMTFFFSMAEGALRSHSRSKFDNLPNGRRKRRIQNYVANTDQMLATAVILTSALPYAMTLALIFVLMGWVDVEQSSELLSPYFLVIFLIAAIIFVLSARMLPLAVGRRKAEKVALLTLPILDKMKIALHPFVRLDALLHEMFPRKSDESSSSEIEEEIRSVVTEGQKEGVIEEDEREMIENIIEFKDALVSEVMTPRTEMESIESSATIEEARCLAVEKAHSRLPVFSGNRDNIVGVFYVRDLIQQCDKEGWGAKRVSEVMRDAYFVPETKQIGQLLRELKNKRVHIAIVSDEYGGTTGLVTIEDILEEIVGEIEDEHDPDAGAPIKRISDHAADLDAKVHIHELNDAMSLNLPHDEGEFDTVGGFVSSSLGKIPKPSEHFRHENVQFTVLDADERKIKRLRVEVIPLEDEDEEGKLESEKVAK